VINIVHLKEKKHYLIIRRKETMLKENSKIVYDFVKAHDGEDFTAQDIADATGLSVRSVNGIVTSAFQRHKDKDKNEVPLMVRVPAEIQDPETGLHKAIKFIQLTDAGRAFDPTAED